MSLRAALLRWYDRAARDLPWRRTRDPYAIWVSEVMLQQTRVETVVPYYERFMARFPTAGALAAADDDDVMAAFSGLGYYRRARLLLAGARAVVARHGGRVPRQREARLALPGVGRYTAGAIGSIAFDLAEPIVDGNVARVLARLHAIDGPLGSAATERRLWEEAEAIVRGKRPGALNQALMELGARVCTPLSPRCDDCPVRAGCAARQGGRVDALPVPRRRPVPRTVRLAAVVATRGGGVYLVRSDGSLFGGLWGLPMSEGRGRGAARAALRTAGVKATLGRRRVGRVVHVLTHRRLEVDVFRATAARAEPADGRRLVSSEALDRLGVSRLTRRLLAAAS